MKVNSKAEVSVCIIKHNTMKMYGGVEVSGKLYAPAALTAVPIGQGGWVGPGPGLDAVK
jgi:hypothetical protein